ncbi:MAG: hypothetical protein OEV64_12690 [Desulfobulbaceae bacterium]|nr:hypothetical protein [Desulfobulbaceae bacterium]
MKQRSVKKWRAAMLVAVSFWLCREVHGMEVPNDYTSPLISQVARYALAQLETLVKPNGRSPAEVAEVIANPPDRASTEEQLKKLRSHIMLLEKESSDELTFLTLDPPIILETNGSAEITVLTIFSVNGKAVRSGMMTFQIGPPYAYKDRNIICGFRLGHVTFSMSPEVQ